jgi:predicted AAA+ superfamily ATPase
VGQLLNLHALAADAGVSSVTAKSWLTLLEASYIVFLLPPCFANVGKRLTKSPKLYFYDVGLASWLIGITQESHLQAHPLRGSL